MKNSGKMIAVLLLLALLPLVPVFSGGTNDAGTKTPKNLSVLVYITGMVAGSPPYEHLKAGAESFAASHSGVTVKVYEAGFNQAEWEQQLETLVASGEYNLVIGSNPSLPELCAKVGAKFPNQKFIITDAQMAGNPQICTYLYNQYEQSLYLGYLAGLITTSKMSYAKPDKKLGFIAAQNYPLLDKHIIPGFLDGARMVDPAITLDTRIIGSWGDANKAQDLTTSMMGTGVDVFASIAGGAAQGMIKAATDNHAYVVYHNTNEYNKAPGVIVGCGIMEQKRLVEEILANVLAGKIQYGTSTTVGVKEGYLGFIDNDPGYTNYIPKDIQDKFSAFMNDIRAGKIKYTVPPL